MRKSRSSGRPRGNWQLPGCDLASPMNSSPPGRGIRMPGSARSGRLTGHSEVGRSKGNLSVITRPTTSNSVSATVDARLVLPRTKPGVVDGDPAGRQLVQQPGHRGRYLTIARHDNGPFQVFAELSGGDLPLIERRRRCRSDLDERPASSKCDCNLSLWQWTTQDEMVVSMHEDTYLGRAHASRRASGTG